MEQLTKVMREAGYIYPFDWRRRRMDREYEEPKGIPISVDDWIDKRERYIAQRVCYNKLDNFPCETGNLFCKKFNKRCIKEKIKYENNDETVNS